MKPLLLHRFFEGTRRNADAFKRPTKIGLEMKIRRLLVLADSCLLSSVVKTAPGTFSSTRRPLKDVVLIPLHPVFFFPPSVLQLDRSRQIPINQIKDRKYPSLSRERSGLSASVGGRSGS